MQEIMRKTIINAKYGTLLSEDGKPLNHWVHFPYQFDPDGIQGWWKKVPLGEIPSELPLFGGDPHLIA